MKQSEIKELSVEELTLAVSPLENPMLIRKTRRTVARIATELNKREIQ